MDDLLMHLFKSAMKFAVYIPFALLILRAWSWADIYEMFHLPTPTIRQSMGLALLFAALAS